MGRINPRRHMKTLTALFLITAMQLTAEEPIEENQPIMLYKMVDVEFFINMYNQNEYFMKGYDEWLEVKIERTPRSDQLNARMNIVDGI